MEKPRVLVISNNSFSKSNSNGRTLGTLFHGWPKDKLAQFCISTDQPDFELCDNYYCVSDRAVLNATLRFHEATSNDLSDNNNVASVTIPKNRIKRTPIKSIFRHLIWTIGIWKGNRFDHWIKNFKPEIVVIQSGDTTFTHDLARSICKKTKAKLVFFNTEGFYFMKSNYLYSGFMDSLFFPIYKRIYDSSYRKAMKEASYAVYLNEMLKNDNDNSFSVPSTVIYNSSTMEPSDFCFNTVIPSFTYLGNFGFNRASALCTIADTLVSIHKDYKLNVYGNPSTEVQKLLESNPGIVFHGFVSYSEVLNIINKSDCLFHAESQEEQFAESLKYGFSTKIADSLCSGRPFVLFASDNIACSKYIIRTQAGWFANDADSLRSALISILSNPEERKRRLSIAKTVAKENHSAAINSQKFQSILISLK